MIKLTLMHRGTTRSHYSEVEPWCLAHVGQHNQDWYRVGADMAHWVHDPVYIDKYYFKDKAMLTMFLLRWS
jgi:hypothetical protein